MNPAIVAALITALVPRLFSPPSSPAPKPGFQSTEFWATGAISIWSAVSGAVPAPWNMIVPAIAIGIYTAARTALKIAHQLGRATAVPDLPDLSALTGAQSPAPVEDRSVNAAPATTPATPAS